jgi:hypothetical protein
MEQVDWEMPTNAYHWTDTHRKLVNNSMRYKTTAERAFNRAFQTVEAFFRDCVKAANAARKAELLRAKIEAQIANKPAEAKRLAQEAAIPLYSSRRALAAARMKAFTTVETIDDAPPFSPADPSEHPESGPSLELQ